MRSRPPKKVSKPTPRPASAKPTQKPEAPAQPKRVPLVIDLTIFADASFHDETGAGGWGAWWKGEAMQFGQTQGGILKCQVASANVAESMALVNAMAAATKSGDLKSGMTVLLQSDCLCALQAFRHVFGAVDHPIRGGHRVELTGRLPKQLDDAGIFPVAQALVQRLALKLMVRHVKGHSSGPGRSWVNRECDRLARAGMVARRSVLLAEGEPRL